MFACGCGQESVCMFVIHTSLRQLFHFTLHSLKKKVCCNFTGVINNYVLIVVAVNVGGRVCS